jgi:glycosyltransferase involved in cell wall biosynthesis
MFTDLPPAPPPGAPIWEQPLPERIGDLLRRPRRVAWIYRAPDTSTFRYRAANMVTALNSDPDCDIGAAWFSETELDAITHLVPRLDAMVLVRYPFSAPLQRLIDVAHHHRVRLVFDSDDLVFDPDLAPMVMDAIGTDREDFRTWSLWFAYMAQVNATMKACAEGLTTGTTLQQRMADYFPDGRVSVVPNFLERRQQEYSQELLDAKRASGWSRADPVTIGYFSGTPTHHHDFAIAAPALARLLRRDPDVRLRVVGSLDVIGEVAEVGPDRVEVVPFMDFLALQRSIAEVEVNIAPLQHHLFTSCKSELKFFEAAAVGTWTVASATPAFTGAIDDGVTGRLARAHEWDTALAEAVDLARDPAAYAEHAERAARRVHEDYAWDTHTGLVAKALAACWTA